MKENLHVATPRTASALLALSILAAGVGSASAGEAHKLTGPYFGQLTPGLVAELFAPDLISRKGRYEFAISFAPGGERLLFTVQTAAGTVQFTNADDSLVFQVGANTAQTVKISIQDVSADVLASNVTNDSNFANLADIDVTTSQGAQDAVTLIDRAIDEVSVIRGDLGAFQANTLEANLDSLRVSAENLQASESIIRDTDMAAEMADFTKYEIMLQAGTAMLARAKSQASRMAYLMNVECW